MNIFKIYFLQEFERIFRDSKAGMLGDTYDLDFIQDWMEEKGILYYALDGE